MPCSSNNAQKFVLGQLSTLLDELAEASTRTGLAHTEPFHFSTFPPRSETMQNWSVGHETPTKAFAFAATISGGDHPRLGLDGGVTDGRLGVGVPQAANTSTAKHAAKRKGSVGLFRLAPGWVVAALRPVDLAAGQLSGCLKVLEANDSFGQGGSNSGVAAGCGAEPPWLPNG